MRAPQIRPATADDIPQIVELIRDFYGQVGSVYVGIPFDATSTLHTVGQVMARGVCLVGAHSCAGAILAPFPYNHAATVAQVAFWTFTNPSGIHIFEALCDACKAAGATHVNAASLYPHNHIDRWYKRFGLQKAETQLMKRL